MSEPFLGEIRLWSLNFVPDGWRRCDGAILPINTNQALFSLLGTMYGGNGQNNFALPNLRGRVAIHRGDHQLGEAGGAADHTLALAQLPQHVHLASASALDGTTHLPGGAFLAVAADAYGAAGSLVEPHPATVANVGGGQPHSNMQPYLTLSYCIAVEGIFPSQT